MIIPKHIAFIMDGNGRWATNQGLPRSAGHKAGGDLCLSNFMLWQSAYACLHVVQNQWPAITKQDIEAGIHYFNQIMAPASV